MQFLGLLTLSILAGMHPPPFPSLWDLFLELMSYSPKKEEFTTLLMQFFPYTPYFYPSWNPDDHIIVHNTTPGLTQLLILFMLFIIRIFCSGFLHHDWHKEESEALRVERRATMGRQRHRSVQRVAGVYIFLLSFFQFILRLRDLCKILNFILLLIN